MSVACSSSRLSPSAWMAGSYLERGKGEGGRVGRWIEGDMGKVNNFWTKRGMCGVKGGIDRSIDDD